MNQQPTTHPLAEQYLAELDRLLQGIDPGDRAEVLEGVREHLDASLAGTALSDGDVRAALAELGPPQVVADEAYAGRPAYVAPPPGLPPPLVPATSRAWLPAVVAVLEGLALLVVLAVGAGGAVVVSTGTSSSARAGDPTPVTDTQVTFLGSIGSGIAGLVYATPFWLVLLVLVSITALWTSREKTVLLALMPVAALAFGVLPQIGWAVFGIHGVYVGGCLALAVTLIGCPVAVWVVVRRGSQRAAALSGR